MEQEPDKSQPEESQAALPATSAEPTGFYYRDGRPIPPTHPDHGPMHLIPRQEDGSFAAFYYCSKAQLAAFDIPSTPPPRRNRRDGFSAERQIQFVEHYRDTGSLTDAAQLTGISRTTAYNLINSPDGEAFRAAIEEAGRGTDTILEATAFERCIKGQEEIVYYKGHRVGVRWKYDNRLLMQMLRARNPLKYAPLSEIEGWLKRRGADQPADIEGALDRLAAAEAEWGRRLPGEELPPAAAIEAGADALPLHLQTAQAPFCEQGAIAFTSSTLPGEALPAPVHETVDRHQGIWEDEEGVWTDYPPPEDFDGHEEGHYRSFGYKRSLTDEEQAVIDADDAADMAEARARGEAQRRAFFGFDPEPQPQHEPEPGPEPGAGPDQGGG